ncbi:UTRA domain-containing protein [Solwaraspora sp. WMMD791]|uniref:UTRA domain-containing protein n=1 Tax=Solwaraspora sp. WMMD791 TaxID=3016086 RepID=UPI00249AF1AC|nr:UTRA domain-containing protein [Solwaraspora sp. WMMD791]WFE27737.1 UTRA domain-containing protein [Solwaraspora sp. WMMD791]
MTEPGWTSSSDPYLVAQQHDAWSAEAAGRGRVGTQQLLGVETVDADTQVRRALGLAAVELADSYYPEPIAAGTPLADNHKIKGGAVRVLADLGLTPHQVSEHVTARRPTDQEQELLDIPTDEPLLVLTRISRAATGQPVEYAVMRTVTSRSTGHTYQMQVLPA